MELDVAELSKALGLGYRDGASTPLMRSFERLVQFDLATNTAEDTYAVRRNLPPVNRRHVRRLPDYLSLQHDALVTTQLAQPATERAARRSRRFALSLLEQGTDLGEIEHQLHAVGFNPRLCRESALWAEAQRWSDEPEVAEAS